MLLRHTGIHKIITNKYHIHALKFDGMQWYYTYIYTYIYICICIYIYIYIYILVLFDPVKPELGVTPSGQENHSKTEHLNFPGRELNESNIKEDLKKSC